MTEEKSLSILDMQEWSGATMPIFEFKCKKCKNVFEELIYSSADQKKITCPKCGSQRSEKLMSVFAGG
ncbi:MAG: zinc ribbon domain-containing protein, partial [Acidobacteria bacterium]|nr:zinc ribbon domain-containing protein [Acidobacteriota bacterium]